MRLRRKWVRFCAIMTLGFCFMLVHRGLGIFNLGSFGKIGFLTTDGHRCMRIGLPLQGKLIQGPWYSEGDALGYYGAGLWPACPMMMAELSCGEFNSGAEKSLVRHYPYLIKEKRRKKSVDNSF